MRPYDEIGLVEAAYELSSDDAAWAAQLCERLTNHLGADLGAVVSRFCPTDTLGNTFVAERIYSNVPKTLIQVLDETLAAFSELDVPKLGWHDQLFSLQEAYPKDHWFRRRFEKSFIRLGALDNVGFVPFTSPNRGATFTAFSSRKTPLSRAIKTRYRRLSPHFSAAMRLRWGGDWTACSDTRLDAVFEPTGSCVHRTHRATGESILEQLSAAVRERETARGALRHKDPDAALGLWNALICGKWSLVDRVEADGRRFVLAVRNEDAAADPRALKAREMQVVALVRRGATNSEIAYELGLTEGGVSAYVHAASRKLRCKGRRELIRLLSRSTDAFTLEAAGLSVRVFAEAEAEPALEQTADSLTHAERAILTALRGGLSNMEISQLRGVSFNTVAKQVASILRKTGRYSRFELMLDI